MKKFDWDDVDVFLEYDWILQCHSYKLWQKINTRVKYDLFVVEHTSNCFENSWQRRFIVRFLDALSLLICIDLLTLLIIDEKNWYNRKC